ncbi:MAG: RsmB/NOP family class I SAM-dependent RNA methyltransferase [Celeribacter sp.]|jgi:16S rRNA (cytosine967-C5)-methyltransferase
MTPAARVSAAISLLDQILKGAPAEKALTVWARSNRYAGSGDRAAIRDQVYSALRRLRSAAWAGGAGEAPTGRALMLGLLRQEGEDLSAIFTDARFAPGPLTDAEQTSPDAAPPQVALDYPAWLEADLRASLGDDFVPVMTTLRDRAPITLRVNLRKSDPAHAASLLAEEGIVTKPNPRADSALTVIEGARRVANSAAYRDGIVELQDAGSQALAQAVPVAEGARVLDYCAGGGGKTLALAARAAADFTAHDAIPARLRDLPERARRAGVTVQLSDAPAAKAFDVVIADVPCSGSGAWRRQPQAKWDLTAARLAELTELQSDILDASARCVAPGGVLAYMTCALLDVENDDQVREFGARHPDWALISTSTSRPDADGDGFFLALLRAPDQTD